MRRKKKRRKNIAGRICVSLMVLALLGILSAQIVRVHNQNEAYKEREALLEEQLAEEEQKAQDLIDEEAYVGSDQYVEDVARTKLGMVYEDEILFKEND